VLISQNKKKNKDKNKTKKTCLIFFGEKFDTHLSREREHLYGIESHFLIAWELQ